MSENAKVTPSSLPANRSTPRSHLVVPLPPVGSSRQTIRGPTPKGQALIRNRSIRQRSVSEPDSTTGSRGNPGPPCLPDARRHRSDPINLALRVRFHHRSTPSPVGGGVTGSSPVPVGASSGWSDGLPEGIPSSRPASTPVCRWPNRWSLAGPAWLRSSPNTLWGLSQVLDPPPSTGAWAPVPVG